ncbi:MAG: hypothetical protein H6513_12170 [Acidimicrobiaceae bacterium]|nr:hypothetical protein [Ilumatobacter sp.]MCB9381433.1 hypothetical protein [Acidimicrobiaceae bacterium]MCO5331343.1 hypothetical protein [Ilumatobacteraceae bacterium]
MNPLQVGAVAGLLVAGAAGSVRVGLRRAPRSVAAAHRRMGGGGPVGGPATPVVRPGHSSPAARWHAAVGHSAAGAWAGRRFGPGLQLAGLTPADVVTRVVVAAGLGLFATTAGLASLSVIGGVPLSPVWLVLAVVASAALAALALQDVRSRIDRQRKEMRRAASEFVQLVAVGLTTDLSVEGAIRFALAIGGGPAFERLHSALAAAPQRGVPVWEALGDLGAQYGLRELEELAASVERQGVHGVSIAETAATIATGMRAAALDDLEREADRANANLSGPTIGFVVTTIVFLAYPLALRITDAFGG